MNDSQTEVAVITSKNHVLPPDSEIGLWLKQANAFIGRDEDLARLTQLLDGSHALVTLFGAPGAGKTRLCARWLAQNPERHVMVCELEHFETRQQLWSALGEALGLRELVQLTSDEANAQILKALQFCEPSVLILDNFEQLTSHGDLLLEWIDAAPQLKILVTTRHRLQLRGERGQLLEGLDQVQGRALFQQRAEELLGFYEPDDEELAAIDRLIEYFDGMPLPIELCASQLLMRSVINITESLEQEALDMQNAWADVPDRQRSLRDAMSTTWALLDENTRLITSRFALFRGAFTIKDAQALCEDIDAPVPPVLLTLRNHSLIRPVEAARGAPMFKLGAIARQYAREVYANKEPDEIPAAYAERALSSCLEALERAERTGKEGDRAIFWARSADLHAIAAGDVRGLEPAHIARGDRVQIRRPRPKDSAIAFLACALGALERLEARAQGALGVSGGDLVWLLVRVDFSCVLPGDGAELEHRRAARRFDGADQRVIS